MNKGTSKAEIGLIGLAVMGENLARNIAGHGFKIVVFNRTAEKTQKFLRDFGSKNLSGEMTLKKFVSALEKPRKIILMVKAGEAIDELIAQLKPLLTHGDIIIDGGNSHYRDTERRQNELGKLGIYLIGMGISGGEEGALNGPSLMPGGEQKAYRQLSKILEAIAAKDGSGGKCVSYIGPGASGHFVKMVHNGIEYGLMQLIAESYDILKSIGKLNNPQLSKIFGDFNKAANLNSFLIQITAKIFSKKEGGKYLIDLIKDIAGQKGTGKWTTEAAHDFAVSLTTINSAVDARILSTDIPSRIVSPKIVKLRKLKTKLPSKKELIKIVKEALEMCSIITYIQGFNLIRAASTEYKWKVDTAEIARIWQGGCIIRSNILKTLEKAFSKNERLAKEGKLKILKPLNAKNQQSLRKLIGIATAVGIPTLTFSSTMAHFDTFLRPRLPQNLIQAQRDFFGAHGYERIDKKGSFHTEWQ